MAFNPFSPLTSKIYGAAAIVAIVAAGAQTIRIEGAFCRDAAAGGYSRCLVTGFRQKVADLGLSVAARTAERDAERTAHKQTKATYRAAQDEAARLERERIARIAAEQKEITDEIVADYQGSLAAARASAERLRAELARAGAGSPGAAGGEPMSGPGAAAGRADAAPGDRGLPLSSGDEIDWRLVATEQALQLDALISWNERQAKVGTD